MKENDKPYVRSFWRIILLFSTFRLEQSVSGHILLLDWRVCNERFDYAELPELQTVKLGDGSFKYCDFIIIESELKGCAHYLDLPNLREIRLGNCALMGSNLNCNLNASNQFEVHYFNSLIMRSRVEHISTIIDLPSLNLFQGDGLNFHDIGSVTLESSDNDDCWHRYPQLIVPRNPIQD